MLVNWSKHAQLRVMERAAKFGLNYGDFDIEIKEQRVWFVEGDCIKTIFVVGGKFFTVIKEETEKYIEVITLWESNLVEVEMWKKK